MSSFDDIRRDPRVKVRVTKTFGQPAHSGAAAGVTAEAPPGVDRTRREPRTVVSAPWGGLKLLEVANFGSEFRAMVGAGMPIPESLGMLARGATRRSPRLSHALEEIRASVELGRSLGAAFDRHRLLFGDLCVEMIAAGEQTGRLEEHLGEIADAYEERHRNRATVLSAMVEPALIVLVGVVVVYIILTVTVPRFRELYEAIATRATLPLPTRILVFSADTLVSPLGILVTVCLIIGAVLSAVAISRNESLRYRCHCLILKVPVFAELIRSEAAARGCRTLGVVIKTVGDVPLGLRLAARTAGNLRLARSFDEAADSVQHGRTIWESLHQTETFPEACVWMIRTGERTGTLDSILPRIASGLETRVRYARDRLLMLLRPALVAVMGALVLAIMLAMYLPIFTLIDSMKR